MTKIAKEEQKNIVMTGKPWIDGIIWGRGTPLSLSRLRLNITYMPAPMVEKILDELDDQYKVQIIKRSSELDDNDDDILPLNNIRVETVYIYISSNEKIFRNLPNKRRDRKISVDNDIEFIEGYLQSIMCSMNDNNIRIHPAKTVKEDIAKVLTFLGIEFGETSILFYVKNPMTCSNPILKRYVSYLDKENSHFDSGEDIQDDAVNIKESICCSDKNRRDEIFKKRQLSQLSDDELVTIVFDKSSRLKWKALEEITFRKNSKSNISEAVQTIYQKKFSNAQDNHMLIDKKTETEIIGILFEWNKLEVLKVLCNKFIHKANRDLAYKYINTIRKRLKIMENKRLVQEYSF